MKQVSSPGVGALDARYVRVIGDDIGDVSGGNYLEIKSGGEINLHGTAKIERHLRVGAGSWSGGASAPTQGFDDSFGYLEFDNSSDDDGFYTLIVPWRWDTVTDVGFSVDWYYTGGQDNGTVCWAIDYKSIKAGEAVTGAGTIVAKTSAGTHTAGQMVRTVFTDKIPATDLEAGDTIGLKLFRDVDGGEDDGDTLATNARIINTHFHFTMDKLGLYNG